jgi:hypothetical protein
VLVRIDPLAAAVESRRRSDPEFVLKVAFALLGGAAVEYEEVVKDGRVVKVEEYPKGRGLVLTARDLIFRLKGGLERRDEETYAVLRSTVNELPAAAADVTPSPSPKIDASAFFTTLSRIALYLSGDGAGRERFADFRSGACRPMAGRFHRVPGRKGPGARRAPQARTRYHSGVGRRGGN